MWGWHHVEFVSVLSHSKTFWWQRQEVAHSTSSLVSIAQHQQFFDQHRCFNVVPNFYSNKMKFPWNSLLLFPCWTLHVDKNENLEIVSKLKVSLICPRLSWKVLQATSLGSAVSCYIIKIKNPFFVYLNILERRNGIALNKKISSPTIKWIATKTKFLMPGGQLRLKKLINETCFID